MRKKTFSVLAALLLVIIIPTCIYSVVLLRTLGAFYIPKNDLNHWSVVRKPIIGPESLQLDSDSGMLYFISNDFCNPGPPSGTLYYLDLNQETHELHEFSINGPKDFHPHGISYFKHPNATRYLFTNNHRADGTHTVEVFELIGRGKLKHRSTVRSDLLTSPNDLVAISPNQFYVTNDGRSHESSIRAIDAFFNRNTGQVLFYDGYKLKVVVDGLKFPNGITYHQSSRRLFVAESLGRRIAAFQRLEDNRLQPSNSLSLAVGIDNISIQDNKLLLASHPNLLALSKYKKRQNHPSPSVVYNVDLDLTNPEIIFQSSGESFSGISSAVRYGQYLVLGNVCNGLLICQKDE